MRANTICIAMLSCSGETDLQYANMERVAEKSFLVLPGKLCRGRPAVRYTHEYKASLQRGPYKHALHIKLTVETATPMIVRRDATDLTQLNTFQQLSNWACRTLKRLFGKPVTLTGLHHSFLSSLESSA